MQVAFWKVQNVDVSIKCVIVQSRLHACNIPRVSNNPRSMHAISMRAIDHTGQLVVPTSREVPNGWHGWLGIGQC